MKDFEVTCSQSLSKTVTVSTDNYIPGYYGEDDDTYNTNWGEEYHDNDHYTPLQLIELFKKHLENVIVCGNLPQNMVKRYKHLINECDGWTDDDTEYIEEIL